MSGKVGVTNEAVSFAISVQPIDKRVAEEVVAGGTGRYPPFPIFFGLGDNLIALRADCKDVPRRIILEQFKLPGRRTCVLGWDHSLSRRHRLQPIIGLPPLLLEPPEYPPVRRMAGDWRWRRWTVIGSSCLRLSRPLYQCSGLSRRPPPPPVPHVFRRWGPKAGTWRPTGCQEPAVGSDLPDGRDAKRVHTFSYALSCARTRG